MTLKQANLLQTYEHLSDDQVKHHINVYSNVAKDAQSQAARMKKLLKLRGKNESKS